MPLESTTTISGLDVLWPLRKDPHNQGDDHFRLVKSVLKATFPGAAGDGLNGPVVASESDFDNIKESRSNLQAQIDVLSGYTPPEAFPQGTRMVFHQAAAPLGWTTDTSVNDHMLYASNSAGGTAGTDNPTVCDKVASHTHPGATNSDGAHSHDFDDDGNFFVNGSNPNQQGVVGDTLDNMRFAVIAVSGAHVHAFTTSINSGADSWTPKRANVIIAVKQ